MLGSILFGIVAVAILGTIGKIICIVLVAFAFFRLIFSAGVTPAKIIGTLGAVALYGLFRYVFIK